jgi:heparosan-N-sulfate-glucuronate 5-epimerase
MIGLRRLALGFPLTWSHRRPYSVVGITRAARERYFVEWDPGHGAYGEDWINAPFDAGGVLLSGASRAYHPIRIAQFALHRFGVWCATGDVSARADFFAQARWLRDRQHPGHPAGLYRFDFPWPKYGADIGWVSAMAQGEAISVLLRADAIEPSNGYGAAARRASLPFHYGISEGGVVWRSGSDVFFEEIANPHAPHVLNGCIFALWGLWELWKRTGYRDLEQPIDACVDTLRRWLARFDTGWWTRYSLVRTATNRPHIATLKYHQFHIAQMRVLAQMFGEPRFDEAAQRWAAYVEDPKCRARVFGAAIASLPDRLLARDTVRGGAHP